MSLRIFTRTAYLSGAINCRSICTRLGMPRAPSLRPMALRRAEASLGPFLLLILAGVFLLGGHPYPAGTLAFGSFFMAASWLEFAPGRLISASQPSRT
jgi:hypothetical protein